MAIVVLTESGELRTPALGELATLARRLTDLVAGLAGAGMPPTPPAEAQDATPLHLGWLSLDPGSYVAVVAGSRVELTAREFRLLWELARSAGRTLTRAELLRRVGEVDPARSRVVDVHVTRLRRKLGPAAGQLATVRGVGYRLDAS
jgi:DNA-binding response OmpR family regulator